MKIFILNSEMFFIISKIIIILSLIVGLVSCESESKPYPYYYDPEVYCDISGELLLRYEAQTTIFEQDPGDGSTMLLMGGSTESGDTTYTLTMSLINEAQEVHEGNYPIVNKVDDGLKDYCVAAFLVEYEDHKTKFSSESGTITISKLEGLRIIGEFEMQMQTDDGKKIDVQNGILNIYN